MSEVILETWSGPAVQLRAVTEAEFAKAGAADARLAALAAVAEFKARAGQILPVSAADGSLAEVWLGLGDAAQAGAFRTLAGKAPQSVVYRLDAAPQGLEPRDIALAFALGAYRFDRYKPRPQPPAKLWLDGADLSEVRAVAHACALCRDMINTPANDLGPSQVESIAREIAEQFAAQCTVIVGDGLLEAGYPAVHAVGRAAHHARAPRMIEITWGKVDAPLIALVGKGVVFDTGGLDLKPSAGMRLMKKDMGGAAHALALGRMIMAAGLPVRLAVLLPIVENAVSGDAMRPGDVIASRKGLSIEVGNTDAEGRLILADALTRAGELKPALTIDLATLTGAARAALGPQLPPFYTDDDGLAAQIETAAKAEDDPLWRMPLWRPYAEALDSDIADLKNDPDGWAQAGSVTAALFLQKFAPPGPWVHLDIFAWNPKGRPGWPAGGEAQAIRALLRMIRERFQ